MKPSWLASAALLLVLLPACTGTSEADLPTLLVVGTGAPAQLQLLEDVYQPSGTPARTLVPVPGSERELPAPPVSLDVVDRVGARSELVVLVHSDAEGVAELRFFDLSDLSATDPSRFVMSRPPLDLTALLQAESEIPQPICPVEVEVSDDGRHAALLDDGSCRESGFPDIYVIDLTLRRLLYALSVEHPAVNLLPAGIHIDQATDLLYFAAGSLAPIEVLALPITGASRPADLGAASISPVAGDDADLARVADGIGLLTGDRLALVPFGDEDQGAVEPVSTLVAAERLLADPAASLDVLVVLSADRVAIHQNAEDDSPQTYPLRAAPVGATLEPVQRFAYLLEAGGVEILDLFPYAEPPASRTLFVSVPGLAEPAVITWAYPSDVGGALP
jgi:hypothetical protein